MPKGSPCVTVAVTQGVSSEQSAARGWSEPFRRALGVHSDEWLEVRWDDAVLPCVRRLCDDPMKDPQDTVDKMFHTAVYDGVWYGRERTNGLIRHAIVQDLRRMKPNSRLLLIGHSLGSVGNIDVLFDLRHGKINSVPEHELFYLATMGSPWRGYCIGRFEEMEEGGQPDYKIHFDPPRPTYRWDNFVDPKDFVAGGLTNLLGQNIVNDVRVNNWKWWQMALVGPLGRLYRKVYRHTGYWENPVVLNGIREAYQKAKSLPCP